MVAVFHLNVQFLVLSCLLQCRRMSDHSEMLDAEETSLAAVTDDSCTLQYIEIIPLDRPADDYCKPEFIDPFVEVKPEDLQDVKQEPADESGNEDLHYSVKVRLQ